MQKVIFVEKHYVSELNDYLQNGWKIIQFHTIVPFSNYSVSPYGAYVVLELINHN